VLAAAAFIVYAVQFSDFGKGGTSTVTIEGAPPARGSPIAVRLANDVGRASLGKRFRAVGMATVAPFGWDHVYVFRDTTGTDMQKRLGFDWPGAPPAVPRSGEHESLIAFVDGKHVAQSAFFSDAIGRLDCLAATDGYQRGTRFVVRFTPKGREPYLTTAQPDDAEAVCLRAVGINP
jgi:hypothetical protein